MVVELTHAQRTLSQRAPAIVGDDLHGLCMDLARSGRELAIIDAMRAYAEPSAHGTFDELINSRRGRHMIDYLKSIFVALGAGNSGQLTTQMLVSWQLVRYESVGSRAYVTSPGLARRLLATELRGLRCGDLRLPYDCVYVDVDPGLGFRVYNESTGWHRLYGVYLTEDMGVRVMTCGEGKVNKHDDALSHFHLDTLTDPERPLEDVIDALRRRVMAEDEKWIRDQGMTDVARDELFDSWVAPFHWVLNLIFYVTHAHPGEFVETNPELAALYRRLKKARGTKARRLRERARALTSSQRIVVGRAVTVDPRLPRTTSESRTLLRRTLVAGHWQRYRVGPGRVDTRWNFREPFWRGAGEEGPRTHEVR